MKKMLIFHPALAPYRIDFFNAIYENFESSFYFSNNNVKDQHFDQNVLRNQCAFQFNLITKGFSIFGRDIKFGIWNLLKKSGAEIVVCSEYSQITLCVLLFKCFINKTLKVYTISDDSLDLSVKRKGIRKIIRSISSKYIDGILFPSDKVCEWYKSNVNPSTKVVSLPIIHDNFEFRKKLTDSLPISKSYIEKYDLSNKKIFLFIGRNVFIKNINTLLDAYKMVHEKIPNTKLLIVGDGEEHENLKEQAVKLGIGRDCIFTGRLEGPSLYAWYNIAHTFILPSHQEAYGAVVNEALLGGCKVICSDAAGASELINKNNGYLFSPLDVNGLATLLIKAYGDSSIVIQLEEIRPDKMSFNLSEKMKEVFRFLNR